MGSFNKFFPFGGVSCLCHISDFLQDGDDETGNVLFHVCDIDFYHVLCVCVCVFFSVFF